MKTENAMTTRNYSPAVYLAAVRHAAGTAAARGAEARREEARNAAAVRLTVSAVLQAAEDAAARRAPVDPVTVSAALTPAPAQTAARPRFDIAAAARAASADYADLLTLDPSARSLPLWYDCLRRAAADLRDRAAAGTLRGFFSLPGDRQFETLRRAASRVPVWASRAARRLDPETAARLLPSARWTLYSSGTASASADERELVFQSSRDYEWVNDWTREGRRGDALDTIAGEAWLRLRSRLDGGKEDPDGEAWLPIYRQTMEAAASIGRRMHDKPARSRTAAASLDGLRDAAGDSWEIEEARLMGDRVPSPEAETVLRETLRAAAADPLDLLILRGREYGLTMTETAAAASVTVSTVSRRLRAMRDRLDLPEASPYYAAHNPAPAPLPSAPAPEARTVSKTPDGWTPPEAPAVPDRTPAPSRAYSAPLTLPAPADRLPLPYAVPETPARAQTGTPEAPEADPLRETLRAADRRASASLARLTARREEEARRREEETARRASAPVRYAPASPEEEARRERMARAAQTVREAMLRRAARARSLTR